MKGHGTDDVGEFDINGYDKDGVIKFFKKYIDQHTVEYTGKLEGTVISGNWEVAG